MSSSYFNSGIALHSHRESQDQLHRFIVHNGSGLHKSVDMYGECSSVCPHLIVYPPNTAFNITQKIATHIIECLTTCDVVLEYSTDINIQDAISWNSSYSLTLRSQKNIILAREVSILNNGSGTLRLMSGMENQEKVGTVIFEEGSSVSAPNSGKIEIYYNPSKGEKQHKYLNPGRYRDAVSPPTALYPYMLVNDLEDLRMIMLNPSKSYALSRSVDNLNQPWIPLYVYNRDTAFSGSFEGNGYTISNFVINRSEDDVGLFKALVGSETAHPSIKNLVLENFNCKGSNRVGTIAGTASHYDFENVELRNAQVNGTNFVGGIAGSIGHGNIALFSYVNLELYASVENTKCVGNLTGATEGVDYDGNHCVY